MGTLLAKGSVVELPPGSWSPGYYSRMFLALKKSGAWRPIVDLGTFSKYMVSPHFQMDTPRAILATVGSWIWATSIVEGRLFPFFYSEVSQEVSPVHFLREGVPVQGHSLRSHDCTVGFYQAVPGGRGVTSTVAEWMSASIWTYRCCSIWTRSSWPGVRFPSSRSYFGWGYPFEG